MNLGVDVWGHRLSEKERRLEAEKARIQRETEDLSARQLAELTRIRYVLPQLEICLPQIIDKGLDDKPSTM